MAKKEQPEPVKKEAPKREIREEREITKVKENHFDLNIRRYINDEVKSVIVEHYTKADLKEIYNNNVKPTLQNITNQMAAGKRKLKSLNVEDNEELRHFIDMQNKVKQLGEKVQLEQQMDAMEKDLVKIKEQRDEIVKMVPELSRQKK